MQQTESAGLLQRRQYHQNLLVAPKDKDPIMKKSRVIYRYKCNRVDCDEEYIGESSRVFGERFKEHQKAPSPIFDHTNTTGHNIDVDNFSIVGRPEPQKSNKRSIVHKGQQSIPEYKHRQIPPATHMG